MLVYTGNCGLLVSHIETGTGRSSFYREQLVQNFRKSKSNSLAIINFDSTNQDLPSNYVFYLTEKELSYE